MKFEELDKQVRSALEDREIQPSPSAWERLESKLDNENKAESEPSGFWWIAAAVAGVVLVLGGMLYTPGDDFQAMPVVEEEVVPEKAVQEDPEVFTGAVPPVRPSSVEVKAGKAIVAAGEAVPNTEWNEGLADKTIIPVPQDHQIEQSKTTEVAYVEDAMTTTEVIAENDTYDQEVDALLQEAMKALEGAHPDVQKKVDAAALLADVEDELDRNFKDKALEAIKRKIVKLRSAVADRNE